MPFELSIPGPDTKAYWLIIIGKVENEMDMVRARQRPAGR